MWPRFGMNCMQQISVTVAPKLSSNHWERLLYCLVPRLYSHMNHNFQKEEGIDEKLHAWPCSEVVGAIDWCMHNVWIGSQYVVVCRVGSTNWQSVILGYLVLNFSSILQQEQWQSLTLKILPPVVFWKGILEAIKYWQCLKGWEWGYTLSYNITLGPSAICSSPGSSSIAVWLRSV